MAITSRYFCDKMFSRMFWTSGISGIALAASNVIDAVCVGGVLGEKGLAAIGIVSPIYILYNVIGCGFSVGGSIAFNHLMGKGKEREAVEHFNSMLLVITAISVILAILGNVFLTPVVVLLGAGKASSELLGLCTEYARVLISAFPLFMLNFMFKDFLRADNNQYRAAVSFVVGSALDFELNILLVVVMNIGIKGSAYATVTAQIVSIAIALPHFWQKDKVLKLKAVKPDLKSCLKSFKTGVSTSIDSLFIFAFLLTANHLLMNNTNVNGEMYVAVFDVIMNISYITGSMFLAAGETLRPLASTFYAEHNYVHARYALKLSLMWGYIINSVIIGAIAVFSRQFSMLFGITSAESLEISGSAVRIFCIGSLISGVAIILSAYYQSIERENIAMRITAMRSFFMLLPFTVAVCLFRAELFWYVMPAAELLTFLFVFIRLYKDKMNKTDDSNNVFSYTLCELEKMSEALESAMKFCEEQEMGVKQTNMVMMFIEETCEAIIRNAFTGDNDEYIQLTIAVEPDNTYVLNVRDSAVSFNPFDMKTKRLADSEEDESFMDSMGILMMKNKAKEFFYRRYQGFNVLMIKF